jgi:hypothetical protein
MVFFSNRIDILFGFFLIFSVSNAESAIKVESYPIIKVDSSSTNLFSTPIAYYNGSIYTINVEPSENSLSTGIDLKTTVRKLITVTSRSSRWQAKVIDNETIADKYHTQASIGIDKHGYLHVAYGMHNMPWQYSVSTAPGSIDSFSFLGGPISYNDKFTVKYLNKTPFPGFGDARIQGNQITYPSFFYDNNGELFLTYRYAIKPKKEFLKRDFAAGIARYDLISKSWISIGGEVKISADDADLFSNNSGIYKTLATNEYWTVYLPRLAFDSMNAMHVSWLWRFGGAGSDTTHPSYSYSPDLLDFYNSKGFKYKLPISENLAEWIVPNSLRKYDALSEIDVDNNYVYVVVHEQIKTRQLYKLDRKNKTWLLPEDMPFSASVLKVDNKGGQWAFATGLKVFYRPNTKAKWIAVYSDSSKEQFSYPKVLSLKNNNIFYVHTQSSDEKKVKIYKLQF